MTYAVVLPLVVIWCLFGGLYAQQVQCYYCSDGVSNSTDCRNTTTCLEGQACRVSTYLDGSVTTYEYGCYNLNACKKWVEHEIQSCLINSSTCGSIRNNTSQTNVCNSCCGNDLCNNDTCGALIANLWLHDQFEALNWVSLEMYGLPSLPPAVETTTTSPETAAATTTTTVTTTTQFSISTGKEARTLSCRHCVNALSLSSCIGQTKCASHQRICYMERTANGEYNAGCKPAFLCSSAGLIGKRTGTCSECCNDSDDCNIHLCRTTAGMG